MSRNTDAWQKNGRPVSSRAVAAAAGCSIATVSRAMNGLPVSPEIYSRVIEAARALGYIPNMAARSMRGMPTMTIGIVFNFQTHPGLEVMAALGTMVKQMQENGYGSAVSFPMDGGADLDLLVRQFAERRVDGLFFWNAQAVDSLGLYRGAGVPVIAIAGRDEGCADFPLVTVDSSPVYREVFQRLRKLGHRSVAEIAPEGAPNVYSHAAVAIDLGLHWATLRMGYEPESVIELLRATLSAPKSPSAILAPYPVMLQLMVAADELGVAVPGDLSLVSTTDSVGARLLLTPLTTVSTDFEMLGRAACETMLHAIAKRPHRNLVISGGMGWTERASIGRARRRRATNR